MPTPYPTLTQPAHLASLARKLGDCEDVCAKRRTFYTQDNASPSYSLVSLPSPLSYRSRQGTCQRLYSDGKPLLTSSSKHHNTTQHTKLPTCQSAHTLKAALPRRMRVTATPIPTYFALLSTARTRPCPAICRYSPSTPTSLQNFCSHLRYR